MPGNGHLLKAVTLKRFLTGGVYALKTAFSGVTVPSLWNQSYSQQSQSCWLWGNYRFNQYNHWFYQWRVSCENCYIPPLRWKQWTKDKNETPPTHNNRSRGAGGGWNGGSGDGDDFGVGVSY